MTDHISPASSNADSRRERRRLGALVVVALMAAAVGSVLGPSTAHAAVIDLTTQATVVTESWQITGNPADPNRCVTVDFAQFPDRGDGSYTAVVLNHVLASQQTFYAGPGYYPDDSYTMSAGGPTHTFTAPAGTHRIVLGSDSSGAGCRSAPRFDIVSVTLDIAVSPLVVDFVPAAFGPGEFQFSPSVSGGTSPFAYSWTYGDGTASSGVVGSVLYTRPGQFPVTLTVTDATGQSSSVTHPVDVAAPGLNVTVDQSVGSPPIELGTPTDVVVKVAAGSGVGALTDLRFDTDTVLSVPSGAFEVVSGPTPAPPASFSLQPDESRSFTLTVIPRTAGRIALRSIVDGVDAAGNPVHDEGELSALLSPLTVIITPQKDDVAIGVDFAHDVYAVTVEVRNDSTTTTVTGLHVLGDPPIVVGPVDGDLAHANSVMAVSEPDPDGPAGPQGPLDVQQDTGVIGTLAPGETSRKLTYYLKAVWPGRSPLEVTVVGADAADPLATITGFGKGSVNVVQDVLVEFGVRPAPGTTTRAGQVVVLDGVVRNVSLTKWVKVLAYPDTALNAGNGFLKDANDGNSATPTAPAVWTLPPSDELHTSELTLRGIVVTGPSPVDASQDVAKVDYTVFAQSSDTENGEYTPIPGQIKAIDTDGYSKHLSIPLNPGDPDIDALGDQCGTTEWFWLAWCGFNVGGGNFVYGIGDLLRGGYEWMLDKGGASIRLIALAQRMYAYGARAVLDDPAARAQLEHDALIVLQTMFPFMNGVVDAQLLPGMAAALVSELLDWMVARIENIVEGDIGALSFSLGMVVGENPDIVVEAGVRLALVAARRTVLTSIAKGFVQGEAEQTAMRAALQKQAAKQEASLSERVAAAEAEGKTGEQLRKATIPGDDLEAVPGLPAKAWGLADSAIAELKKLCDLEEIIILTRGRGEAAIKLIEDGLAWAKPEWMKAKNVNLVDLRIFGNSAREIRRDVVVLAKPPFEVDWLKASEADIDAAARQWMAAEGLDVSDGELLGRVKQRASEWAAYSERFGLDAGTPRAVNANIAWNPTDQGHKMAVKDDWRQFRVAPEGPAVTDSGWTVYELQMSGPVHKGFVDPATFRAITGDVDLLGVLHLNGEMLDPILDAAKRTRVYEALERILDIQHGETMSYFDLEKRAKWLLQNGDEIAVVDPTTVRRGRVIEASTIALDTANAPFTGSPAVIADGATKRSTFFVLVDGARPVLQTRYNRFFGVYLPRALASMREIVAILEKISVLRIILTPLKRFSSEVNGLTPAQVPPGYSRTGPIVQPDGAGGLWRFTPGGGGPVFNAAPLRSFNAVAAFGPAAQGATSEPPPGWTPISVADALGLGEPDTLDLAPMTALFSDAPAGSTRLDVAGPVDAGADAGSAWFEPGDSIVIDPGGEHEEYATVAALGSIIVTEPLEYDHGVGELVVLANAVPEPPSVAGTPPPGVYGSPYSFALTVDGFPTPLVTVHGGRVPRGLSLDAHGVLAGTPTAPGVYRFVVVASNELGRQQRIVTVRIDRAQLVVRPNDVTAMVGDHVPSFTVSADGLVGTDTLAGLRGRLQCSTHARTSHGRLARPGTYSITCRGLADKRYAIRFEAGILTVLPADRRQELHKRYVFATGRSPATSFICPFVIAIRSVVGNGRSQGGA